MSATKDFPRVEMLAAFGPYQGGWRDGEFHTPEGMVSDHRGNLFVGDEMNHRVQKIGPDGEFLWKIGAVGPDARPRAGTAIGEFMMLRGVGVDAEDSLYVLDRWNNRVQVFDARGRFRLAFGSYGDGPGQFGGAGPNSVAIDADGFVYITDSHTFLGGNNRVQKFDARGRFVLAFGQHGSGPGQFAGRVPLRGRFGHEVNIGRNSPEGPYGIDVGPQSGELYVADTQGNRIQIFTRDGQFLRSIGEGLIFGPRQLCLDSGERIHVAGFHQAPDIGGLGRVIPTGPQHRFLWVLDRRGEMIARITAEDAHGLFVHGGGNHHGVAVSKVDEGLVYLQSGHHVLKFRIHW